MKVTVIGTGYVGLVAGACFSEVGNSVICVDINEEKINNLKKGIIPIFEPGLSELVSRNYESKRLDFTTDIKKGIEESDIIFIAVGTPQDEDGSADLTYVLNVAKEIGKYINAPKIIVDKSTVPVGTAKKVYQVIDELTDCKFTVVSNPEFLREGTAIDDFINPDRVIIGADEKEAMETMLTLYQPFVRTNNNPILTMDVASAEMSKYAANAMLATRISFMNEMAMLCERVGANVSQVRRALGSDERIGSRFLLAGIGYGGSCFPKDVQALIKTSKENNLDLLVCDAVQRANLRQKSLLTEKITKFFDTSDLSGKTFAVWGLAFKANTDDVREASSLVVCQELIDAGAKLKAYDPEAVDNFKRCFGDNDSISYVENDFEVLNDCDALVICTEWDQFLRPDFDKIKNNLKSNIIFDGRNLYDPDAMFKRGITYLSIGRGDIIV